jgi:hypothetical protein
MYKFTTKWNFWESDFKKKKIENDKVSKTLNKEINNMNDIIKNMEDVEKKEVD